MVIYPISGHWIWGGGWLAQLGFHDFAGSTAVHMVGGLSALIGAAIIFVATNLAAATATVGTLLIRWILYKKPDVSMTLSGSPAGLVAITAGCDAADPIGAFFIGLISAFAFVFGIEFIDKKLKIDDPVGAVGVHCINGALGTLLVGLFAKADVGSFWKNGLFYGGGFKVLGIQAIGVFSAAAYAAAGMKRCRWYSGQRKRPDRM